jgi:hypothetical protein
VRALIDSYGYANEGIKRFESQDPKSAAVLQDPAEINKGQRQRQTKGSNLLLTIRSLSVISPPHVTSPPR